MSRNLRSISLALVFVLGTTTAVQAFPMNPRPKAVEGRVDLLGAIFGWITTLLTPEGSGVTLIWEEEGSSMDPNRLPRPEAGGTSYTDEGSQMDPNG